MSRVEAKNIWKIYEGGVEAVKDANFYCEDREFIVVLGPSGSGKTSILRMIAGLENITKGEILFDKKIVNDLTPIERNIALAFENYALYFPLTVYENIAFPLKARGLKKSEVDKKVKQIAKDLDLTDILNRKPFQLSGGQQQRISLARAMIRNPNVFLLDEPLSHTDQHARVVLRAIIKRIHDESKATTIYVTHDQQDAISLADRIIAMDLGRIQQIGTVDDLWNHPVNKFVAGFLGEPAMNFFEGRIENPQEVSITGREVKAAFRFSRKIEEKYVGCEVIVGIRPQNILVYPNKKEDRLIPSLLEVIEPLGEEKILTVKLNDAELKIFTSNEIETNVGQIIWMEFKPENIYIFDKETENVLS